jgi:hypothetical protein
MRMRRGGGFLFLGLGLSSVSTFDVSFLKVFLRFQTEENQKKTKENQKPKENPEQMPPRRHLMINR